MLTVLYQLGMCDLDQTRLPCVPEGCTKAVDTGCSIQLPEPVGDEDEEEDAEGGEYDSEESGTEESGGEEDEDADSEGSNND